MKELEKFAKEKKEYRKKVKKPRIWREKDLLDGKVVNAFVLILRTKGCYWAKKSGCLMCGYYKETYDAEYEDIKRQIDMAYKEYKNEEIVKIFTSGSFLDEQEIPKDLQLYLFKKFKAKKFIIESRPEFIDNLENFKDYRIEVAMGLESANDVVLEYCINKGFKFNDWKKGAEKVISFGKELKVYLLIKPPFLTEKQAIMDALYSVEKIKDLANTISFNPVSIHSKTVVEMMWRKKLYRPPWLWTVIDILKKTKEIYNGVIKCDVVAGGKERGSHNCGKCDKKVLNAIKEFSLTQDEKKLEKVDCECKEEWLDILEIERFLRG